MGQDGTHTRGSSTGSPGHGQQADRNSCERGLLDFTTVGGAPAVACDRASATPGTDEYYEQRNNNAKRQRHEQRHRVEQS